MKLAILLAVFAGTASAQISVTGPGGDNRSYVDARIATQGAGSTIVGGDASIGAENGWSEKFFSDYHGVPNVHNADGTPFVPGFDTEFGVTLSQATVVPANTSSPMGLVRQTNTSHPTQLFAQDQAYFGGVTFPNNNNCVGFNNAAGKAQSTTPMQRLAVCTNSNTAYLINGAQPGCNSGNPTACITALPVPKDSAGNPYTGYLATTLWVVPDLTTAGTFDISVSMVEQATNGAVTFYAKAVPIISGINNFEISGGGPYDNHVDTRYAVGGVGATQLWNLAYSPDHTGLPAVLVSDTLGTSMGYGSVFMLIPPSYKPGVANRWVMYMHGLNEPGYSVTCQPYAGCNPGVAQVARSLMNAGYVVIGMGAGGSSSADAAAYGNAYSQSYLATVYAEARQKLSLAPNPYAFAESMGGAQMLTGISKATVPFRAFAGCCLNTNIAQGYYLNYTIPGTSSPAAQSGSIGPSAPGVYGVPDYLTPAYSITGMNPYAVATSGYDPQLVAQSGGTGLLNFVRTPGMIWASYSDGAVNRLANSDLFASTVNAAGGHVTVVTCTGGHEDLSCFQPSAVVNFFNSN